MNKRDVTSLGLHIAVTAIITGTLHSIFSPEPTVELAVGYALFMGSLLGTALYFLDRKTTSRKK